MIGIATVILGGASFLGYWILRSEKPITHGAARVGDVSSPPSKISRVIAPLDIPVARPPSPRPIPQPETAQVSSGQSESMKAFLLERDRLQQDRQKLIEALRTATPEERRKVMEKWHAENAPAHTAQQELAIKMGAEFRPPQLRIPPEPRIPENATPELREFLTARYALMKDQSEMMNQLADASPEERQQATQKWHEQSATRREAMQATASKLSKASSRP